MVTTSAPAAWSTVDVSGSPRLTVDQQGSVPLLVFMHGIGGNRTN